MKFIVNLNNVRRVLGMSGQIVSYQAAGPNIPKAGLSHRDRDVCHVCYECFIHILNQCLFNQNLVTQIFTNLIVVVLDSRKNSNYKGINIIDG